MKTSLTLALVAFTVLGGAARAEAALVPLAAHRAAYEISLAGTDVHEPANGQTPVAATGLIAYEFRGSACEGYASNFRQVTQLQRSEGDPYSSDVSSVTFEDGDGKGLKFEIEGHNSANDEPPISGSAARLEGGATTVELMKPSKSKVVLGQDILFPTQHIERIIAKAKDGGGPMEAKVYDGSDTGQKVFQTLAIIGHEASGPSPDADAAPELAKVQALAGDRFLFQPGGSRRAARIRAHLRPLRERRLRLAEARLRRLCALRQAFQARMAEERALREVRRL